MYCISCGWPSNSQNQLHCDFARVVFGVSSSPFLLNATIWFHLERHALTEHDLMSKLTRFFYVDEVVTGANDEDQAHILYETSKQVVKEGGFNLRKFHTNSTLLQIRIDNEGASTSQLSTSQSTAEVEETYSSFTLCPIQNCVLPTNSMPSVCSRYQVQYLPTGTTCMWSKAGLGSVTNWPWEVVLLVMQSTWKSTILYSPLLPQRH